MAMFTPNVNGQTAQTLFDLVGPGTAGQYIGQQRMEEQAMNPINRNLSLAELAKAEELNRHNSVMNPYLEDVGAAQSRDALSKTPEFFQSQRRGQMADDRSKLVKAGFDEATAQSKIKTQLSDDQIKQTQNFASELMNVGAFINSVPDEIDPVTKRNRRQDALSQLATSAGLDKNPLFSKFMQVPTAQMPQFLDSIAKRLMETNPQLRNQSEIHAASDASRERVAAGNNAATVQAAEINAASRKKDTIAELQKELGKDNYTAGEILARIYAESGDMVGAKFYETQAKTIKQHQISKAAAGANVQDQRTRDILNGNINKTPEVPNGAIKLPGGGFAVPTN